MTAIKKAELDKSKLNSQLEMPYALRLVDFEMAIQDVYDFFFDVNTYLLDRGLQRLEDMLRPANLSGTLSDMVTDSLAQHSRTLTVNMKHNGHPDLLVKGRYPNNEAKAGEDGVEVKTTRKPGGAVDTHGGRDQTMCVFVYDIDNDRSKAAADREPLRFREVYLSKVTTGDFRRNERGELGTRTATLHADGVRRFREGWVYLDLPSQVSRRRQSGPWRQE